MVGEVRGMGKPVRTTYPHWNAIVRKKKLVAAAIFMLLVSAAALAATSGYFAQKKVLSASSCGCAVTPGTHSASRRGQAQPCDTWSLETPGGSSLLLQTSRPLPVGTAPNQGQWSALYGTIQVNPNGTILYTAPALRPIDAVDSVEYTSGIQVAVEIRLLIKVTGGDPMSADPIFDDMKQQQAIDPNVAFVDDISQKQLAIQSYLPAPPVFPDSEYEPAVDPTICIGTQPLPDTGVAVVGVPFNHWFLAPARVLGATAPPAGANSQAVVSPLTVQVAADTRTAAPNKCNQCKPKNRKPKQCKTPTEADGTWAVPGRWMQQVTGRTGRHSGYWTGMISVDVSAQLLKKFGVTEKANVTITVPYTIVTTTYKQYQFTDFYRCENGQPVFDHTMICEQDGSTSAYVPGWIYLLLQVPPNGTITWIPTPPICRDY